MGARGPALNLIKTYLEGRYQYTVVNGQKSHKRSVKFGVPQGSVLGPLLYLLYVENISDLHLGTQYFMFADDTVLLFASRSEAELENNINNTLIKFYEWLCTNKLVLNEDKTVYMRFEAKNKKTREIIVELNNKTIRKVKTYRYLGLVVDEELNWGAHIEGMIKKLSGLISASKHASPYMTKNTKLIFYNACVHSIFTYLASIWGNTTKMNLSRLQRLQNRAIKNIYNLPYETRTSYLYERFPVLPISEVVKQEQCKLIYRIDRGLLKSMVKLKRHADEHEYSTRNANHLYSDCIFRTTRGLKLPSYSAIKSYNGLPNHLKNEEKYTKFKKELKKLFKGNLIV